MLIKRRWLWLFAGRDWGCDVRRWQLFIALLPRPEDTEEGEIIRCWRGWDIYFPLLWIVWTYRYCDPAWGWNEFSSYGWTGRRRQIVGWKFRGLRCWPIGDGKTPGHMRWGDGSATFNEGEWPNFYFSWRSIVGFRVAICERFRFHILASKWKVTVGG